MTRKKSVQPYGFQTKDVYSLTKTEWEVDTDVNEDPHREVLLDQSADAFIAWQAKKAGDDSQSRNS